MEDHLTFNGFPVLAIKPSFVFSVVLAAIPDLKYWSHEALKALVTNLLEMVSTLEDWDSTKRQKSQFRSFRKRLSRFLEFVPKDRDLFLEKIYNLILDCDGLSHLYGFGLSNGFGDRLMGDPEYQSIYATANGR